MTRRSLVILALMLATSSCGRLGLGEQICEPQARRPTPANMLAAQAVPSAKYTPCFNSLGPGWEDVDFVSESGRAGLAVKRNSKVFLTAIVTESCDVGAATRVESGHQDIEKYEDVVVVPATITITVIPTGPSQVVYSDALVDNWWGLELDERPVALVLDLATETPIGRRVGRALEAGHFVWVIDELDVAEHTLEMRAPDGSSYSRLTAVEALEEIEDSAPQNRYQGNWYFTFEGGCITYTFDAEGPLAETVADDVAENVGFYPAYQLREDI